VRRMPSPKADAVVMRPTAVMIPVNISVLYR
jgi:hypothetical protein